MWLFGTVLPGVAPTLFQENEQGHGGWQVVLSLKQLLPQGLEDG